MALSALTFSLTMTFSLSHHPMVRSVKFWEKLLDRHRKPKQAVLYRPQQSFLCIMQNAGTLFREEPSEIAVIQRSEVLAELAALGSSGEWAI